MINRVENIPIPTRPASIPGQKDLLEWAPRTEPKWLRKCGRCGELPPVIYDGNVSPSGCPVCRCPEFSLVKSEEGNEAMTATAAPPRKLPSNSGKGSKAKDSCQSLDFTNRGIDWEEIDIEVKLIRPRPGQPRKYFDPEKLEELADNIELLGVLQRVLVQKVDDGYQLIAGERRWRACELRGRKLIPARVVNATEEQIELICLTENLQREGLTVIEEAEAYQLAIDNLKCTQTQLARKLGVSQGQISNRIRLLRNPPAIRAAIISGEIDTEVGRDVATWCDVPAVREKLDEWAAGERADSPLEKQEIYRQLSTICWRASRPVNEPDRSSEGKLRALAVDGLPPAVIKRLDIRGVARFYGGRLEDRAFNLELWDELAVDYVPPTAKKPETPVGEATPADLERRQAQKESDRQESLERYLVRWFWSLISLWIPDAASSVRWRMMCYFATRENWDDQFGTHEELCEIVTRCGGQPVVNSENEIDLWASMATVGDPETFASLLLAKRTSEEATSSYYTVMEMAALGGMVHEFGITLAEHWNCERAFLELHDTSELVNLLLEWKRRGPGDPISEREPLIDWMLQENDRKKFPAPKCLTKLKLFSK